MKRGNAIRLQREKKGWTQRELASKLNVTPAAVAMWELGNQWPRIANAVAMAELFGCTLDVLLGLAPADPQE